MSRKVRSINNDILFYYGFDHVLGRFIQISDSRFKNDPSGDGYVYEWDEKFGESLNKINYNKGDNDRQIIKKCNKFIKSLL